MSLRSRVLVAIAMVLCINAALGAGLAAVRAHAALRSELAAAMQGAERSVRDALRARVTADPGDLRRLIQGYDGDRHLRAVLLGPDGRPRLISTPFRPTVAAPEWFSVLVDPRLAAATLAAPGGLAIRLDPAPGADLADSWLNFADLLAVLTFACLLGCGLVFVLIGQALKPLAELAASFRRIGAGDYQIRVDEGGVSEVAGIGRAFNLMAEQLASMRGRNRLLEEQLLRLQDEERADLARDLHDDIGPYLFAVNVDASMISQLATSDRIEAIPEQVRSIQANVAHMQARVRDILARLRPTRVIELGFQPAIQDLVEFWRARSPEIDFTVELKVDERRLSDDVREAAYRVVQEGLNNAVRHGRPSEIRVSVSDEPTGELVVQVRDNGVKAGRQGGRAPGFGIAGMRERVVLAGGTLDIERDNGWLVLARLPTGRRRRARRAAA
jgi:two-component system sensor histidine kinase UhpB